MVIIMLGAPGTGKGTVGGLLSKELDIVHKSSCEIFRSYLKKHNNLSEEIEKYISKGNLVPDNLAIELVEKRLTEPDVEKGVILDGYPRTVNQAMELDKLLDKIKKRVDVAVHLSLPDEEILSRIINRRTCPNPHCREIYNTQFKPPKVEGICDSCGAWLVVRPDDNEETVKQRLRTYHQISENLINFYKDKDILYTVKLNERSHHITKDVAAQINKYIEGRIS